MKHFISKIKELFGEEPRDFLLKIMPQKSIVAEIGVYKGEFSKRILKVVKPTRLHLIDPWKFEESDTYKKSFYGGEKGINQINMDKIYNEVLDKLNIEINRNQVIIHRSFSSDAVNSFQDNYLDWIYIDGNHLYDFVKKDLENYYPKVKMGGFIAGDDYDEGGWWQGGVKKAVDEFIEKWSVQLIMIKHRQFILKKV